MRSCLLALTLTVFVAASGNEFRSELASSTSMKSAVPPTLSAATAVDHIFNGQQYMSWGPSRTGYNFQLGFQLTGSGTFSMLLITAAEYTQLYYNNVFPKYFFTYYSLIDVGGGNLYPPYVGTGPSEPCYFVIITRPGAPTTRVQGTVWWTVYSATQPNVTMPMDAPVIRSYNPDANVEIKPIGLPLVVESSSNLKSFQNITLAPGSKWVSPPVLKGQALAIGYMINGTNRFNILLMDKENLGKLEKREIFNYYPFYSRLDVFGAHLEGEAVINLPNDLYLVIFCVDSFQQVSVWGDIHFEQD